MKYTAARRESLSQESARQRQALRGHLDGLRPALGVARPIVRLVSLVRRWPALSALASLLIAQGVRRSRWLRYTGVLALVWKAGRLLRTLFRGG